MDADIRNRILQEAMRIGDEIIAQAERSDGCLTWRSLDPSGDGNRRVAAELYSGVAGIVLFFVELFKQAGDEKYLRAARQGRQWLMTYCEGRRSHELGFFWGRSGVVYACCASSPSRFFGESGGVPVTGGSPELVDRICGRLDAFPGPIPNRNDLISGAAGSLLGLQLMLEATQDRRLLQHMETLVLFLIAQARFGPQGLYWDRSVHNIHGLCGLAHGASGIGAVFLELGSYLGNKAFFWLAEQAFSYEAGYFDEKTGNWPDFRKGFFTEEFMQEAQQRLRRGDLDWFRTAGSMNAWCNGAAGIGLTRLRAFELLGTPRYRDEARAAIEKTVETELQGEQRFPSFTLCHGGCGNGELFIQAFQTFGEEKYLALALEVALNAVATRERTGVYESALLGAVEDPSLFLGNAGIGYFLLRLLQPQQVPSLLYPRVSGRFEGRLDRFPTLALSLPELKRRMVVKACKRTLHFLERDLASEVDRYFAEPANGADDELTRFADFVALASPRLLGSRNSVTETFKLEWEKVAMERAIDSEALLFVETAVQSEDALGYTADRQQFESVHLTVNGRLKWVRRKVNPEAEGTSEADEWVLLRPIAGEGIGEEALPVFTRLLLQHFTSGCSVAEVAARVARELTPATPEEEAFIQATVRQQVKELCLANILVLQDRKTG